jgi:hypothetical protein
MGKRKTIRQSGNNNSPKPVLTQELLALGQRHHGIAKATLHCQGGPTQGGRIILNGFLWCKPKENGSQGKSGQPLLASQIGVSPQSLDADLVSGC